MTHPETRRLLLQLGRRLRSPGQVPAAELATVPQLLQRYGLRDQQLFEDFCNSSAKSWQVLSPSQMSSLFRGTENYRLLHATKGPALDRLVASLRDALRGEPGVEGMPPLSCPAALAALCHGALAPRGRAACRPLLEELRVALQARLEAGKLSHADALQLLGAAGELHRAIGVSIPTLQELSKLGREALQADEGLSPGQLSLAARASGRLLPVLPTEASDLFKALLEPLSKREAKDRELVLVACRQLDASLRRLLADTDLLRSGGAEVRPSNIEVRLQILYGLPLHAAALEDMEACKDLARVVEAWVQKLLEAKDAPAYALATAYLAATTVRHALLVAEEEALASALGSSSTAALAALARHWRKISANEINILFRTPGDVSDVTAEALKQAETIEDVHALVVLLQVSHIPPGAPGLADAACTALMARVETMTDATQLSTLEAATRKGPKAGVESQRVAELRQRIRSQLFKAVLNAKPIWHSKPNRGFIRYVEKCLEKDRRPKEDVAKGHEELFVAQPASPDQEPSALEIASFSSDDPGVRWHHGVGSWEARINVGGHDILGGYFKPRSDDEDSVMAAKEEALQCRKDLELRYIEPP